MFVIEGVELDCRNGRSVTISFGVTSWQHGETLREVCKRADDALFDVEEQTRSLNSLATPVSIGEIRSE